MPYIKIIKTTTKKLHNYVKFGNNQIRHLYCYFEWKSLRGGLKLFIRKRNPAT